MTVRIPRRAAALLAAAAAAIAAPSAGAFDTGPHFDITRDALAAEGFSEQAIRYVQVSNWFVDLYENAESIPFSGHAGFGTQLVGGGLLDFARWPDAVVRAADQSHFDATSGGFANTAALSAEWDRLRRAVGTQARETRDRRSPESLLTVLGISLHQVQDFYSHTNWLESSGPLGRGPAWAGTGWGATPTWFDIPGPVRDAEDLYSGGSRGIDRDHGSWRADENLSLTGSNAKDWPGRPLYTEAHLAAYFATRQWVRAVRAHLGDEAFWARAAGMSAVPAGLEKDQRGALNISAASGHWQGQGEACNPSLSTLSCGPRNGPGGNLLDLRGAVRDYFDPNIPSRARYLFERYVPRLNDPNAAGELFPVASSRPLQQGMRFVRLQVTRMAEIDSLDTPGDADMFLRARIGTQRYVSGVINDRDSFDFRLPHAPYAFLRSVPRGAAFDEPVQSIRVRVRTGDVRFAGTDDDVYLRVSDTLRLPLDKRLYDDFERGDDDTYSAPIDDAAGDGLRVGDLRFMQIEKSPDGAAGGWRLGGVQVWVNDRLVVSERRVDRWLEDDRRTWRAPGFRPGTRFSPAIGASLQLWEQDAPLRGGNDHVDINPFASRRDLALAYTPAPGRVPGESAGGSTLGGRLGDGDRGRVSWRFTTIDPVPGVIVPAPTPAPGTPLADLRVTAFAPDFAAGVLRVTVTNAGTAAAGPFLVSVSAGGTVPVAGLAPGASTALTVPGRCREGLTQTAVADSAGQVPEAQEADNAATIGPFIC
ncbi:MAG: hypothetical protein MUE51_06830 [Thermoleophilia bacterium]|nr:hypothetical protein [Thermoleophilia bacterium]